MVLRRRGLVGFLTGGSEADDAVVFAAATLGVAASEPSSSNSSLSLNGALLGSMGGDRARLRWDGDDWCCCCESGMGATDAATNDLDGGITSGNLGTWAGGKGSQCDS